MTDENHCYENAMAERVNVLLKVAFYLDHPDDYWNVTNVAHAKRAAKNESKLYNDILLHVSLTIDHLIWHTWTLRRLVNYQCNSGGSRDNFNL